MKLDPAKIIDWLFVYFLAVATTGTLAVVVVVIAIAVKILGQ